MTAENTIARSLRGDSRQPARDVAQGFSPEIRPKGLSYIFNWLLIIFFFLLPFQTRYILREMPLYEYGTLSVFLVEVLGWVVVALGVVRMRRLKIEDLRFKWWLIGLVASTFISILWASDKAVALQAAVRLLEGVLLYFVISTCTTPNPSQNHPWPLLGKEGKRRGNESISSPARGEVRRGGSEWIMYTFLAGAILQALIGIFQFLTQSTFASTLLGMALHDPAALGTAVVEAGGARWLRAYGGLPHPNVFGGYLAIATAVAIARWQRLQMSQKWQRLVLVGATLILLTGIFFSFSRAAWVAGIGLLGYWVIKSLKDFIKFRHFDRAARRVEKSHTTYSEEIPRLRFTPLGMTILYLVLLVIVYRPLVVARVFPESHLEVKSRVERVQGVREAWEIVKRHPVVGVGIGNYTQTVARELRPNQPLWSYQPVHSVPLLVWAELGIMGLVLFLAILYFIFRQLKPNALMFSCFFVLMILDHYLWSLPFGILLFWSALGVAQGFSLEKSGLKA